jgi:hypothetical protein
MEFFGVNMDSVRRAKDFVITSYNEEGVKYNISDGVNSKISAYGYIDNNSYYFQRSIKIIISNQSNYPISVNYFTDRFQLIKKDGNVYNLEQSDLPGAVYSASLNPGTSTAFHPILPRIIKDIKKEDIALIVCEIGLLVDRVRIVLKPLPEIKNTQPESIKK